MFLHSYSAAFVNGVSIDQQLIHRNKIIAFRRKGVNNFQRCLHGRIVDVMKQDDASVLRMAHNMAHDPVFILGLPVQRSTFHSTTRIGTIPSSSSLQDPKGGRT